MKFLTYLGKTINLPNSDLITVLQDANLITPFVEAAIKPATFVTKWDAIESRSESAFAYVQGSCSAGHSVPVLSYPEKFFWSHCGKNEAIPPAVVKKFYTLQKAHS
jgi:hypothetical protein